ncbi:hypothetical protein [Sphingopyxis sp.]|uniref:hypothetical protein n=1 Tax=Sphingopyxis sp. TaxID=1908224 RepID=UPI003D0AAFBA
MHGVKLAAGALLALAACSPGSESNDWSVEGGDEIRPPSSEDARRLLQSWFDANPQCTPFFTIPHDVAVEAEYSHRLAQAFVDAGLLERQGEVSIADPNSGSGARKVVRYIATPEGRTQFKPGKGALADTPTIVCYGTRDVKDVKVGEIGTMGDRVSVAYSYRLSKIPAWARSSSIVEFYPTFQQWLDRDEEANEELVWKGGNWSLERPPSSGMFDLRQLSH